MKTRIQPVMWAALHMSVMACLCLLLAATSLQAQHFPYSARSESMYSVMAGVGYAHTDFNRSGSFSGVESAGTPHYRVMLDYRPIKYVGFGIGMANIGSTAFRGLQSSSGTSVSQVGETRALSAEAYITGHLPLTVMSCLYSRGGVGYLNVSKSSVTDGASTTVHSNGFSPFVGIGAEVQCLKQVGLRMGFDWYFNAGDPAVTGQGSVSTAYAGFVLRFQGS